MTMKRIIAEPHPEGAGEDDLGNRYDTEQTFGEVLAHNEVFDRLWPRRRPIEISSVERRTSS